MTIDPTRPHSFGPGRTCPDCPEDRDHPLHRTFPRQPRTVRWGEILEKVEAAGSAVVVVLPGKP